MLVDFTRFERSFLCEISPRVKFQLPRPTVRIIDNNRPGSCHDAWGLISPNGAEDMRRGLISLQDIGH